MTQITDKENKKAVPVAAARQGAAGVVGSICQGEKDTTGRGRNETFQPLRWCWKQQTVTKIKKPRTKQSKTDTHHPPPQLKYTEAKCLFLKGFDIVALDGIGLFVRLQHQPAFQAFLWRRAGP